MVPWLDEADPLPPTSQALDAASEAPGLLAASRQISLARLEQAYRAGVFPWFSPGQPVLWWAPDPRMVLPVSQWTLSRSMRKTLRRFVADARCEIRVDTAFGEVIRACASAPRAGQRGTWIVPAMVQAYEAWHRAGRVHSVETWVRGELVGGLYGVAIGRMFFGESMFARRTDASKIALAALVALCRHHGVALIDCQQNTRHLASLGAEEWPREAFEAHLQAAVSQPELPAWTYHPSHWSRLGLEPGACPPPEPTEPTEIPKAPAAAGPPEAHTPVEPA